MLAVQSASAVTWAHQEPFSKGQRFTNSSGTMTSTVIEVDPFGGETSRSANSAFQPQRFTSYVRDVDGGDDAMHRRYGHYYARFSQPDPYDGSYSLTDPQSFNRYSYVQNDPVNFVDPLGLEDIPPEPCLGCPIDTVQIPVWGRIPGGSGMGGGFRPDPVRPSDGEGRGTPASYYWICNTGGESCLISH
jgi:RHS repeat-associated protein